MDINSLSTAIDHEEGAEVNILCPVTNKPTDVFIKVKGPDSKDWRKQKKKQTHQIIQARANDKFDDLDFEQMDIAALMEITIDWRGIKKDGKEFKCTKENMKYLYENSPRIVEQLLTFVFNVENFTNG